MRVTPACMLALLVLAISAPLQAWDVYRCHPFVEATADQLPHRLTVRARDIRLRGLRNDWVHGGVAIATTGEPEAICTVSLKLPPALEGRLRLRVVGFIEQKGIGYVLDPIFDDPGALELDKYKQYMRNFENIHGFPTVTATPTDPVVLWITADTRGLSAGRYTASLRVNGARGHDVVLPIRLTVLPYQLPEENPLITQGWEWIPGAPTKREGARLLREYGINACHVDKDMEAAREAGFRFFMFVFRPSWHADTPEEADECEVDERIAQIKAMIEKLDLKPDQWALYTRDEPTDKTVPGQVKWCRYIKKKWPQARFIYNPAWGGDPYNPNVTVEGTIRPLVECADVWLPYSWWVTTSIRKGGLELMKSTGKPVWFYEILSFKYNRRPTVGRDMLRTLAWVAAKYRLQGASWYSLNATDWPWSPDPKNTGHGCIYGTIPGRGLEALRQGIQEHKRISELRRLGVPEETIQRFADRALSAKRVRDIDRVRREMDEMLLDLAGG